MPIGMSGTKINHQRGIREARHIRRREEAEDRQIKYNVLTLEQRVAMIDKIFGPGKGATRQRAKLAKQILAASKTPAPTKNVAVDTSVAPAEAPKKKPYKKGVSGKKDNA